MSRKLSDVASSKDLAPYTRQIEVADQHITYRDSLAEEFINKSDDYYVLKPDQEQATRTDSESYLIDDLLNMAKDEARKEAIELADLYFMFKFDFFKFTGRPERNTLQSLILKPFSHADIEEQDIEKKFPEDMKIRALIRALYLIIRHNQEAHIWAKRRWQIFSTAIYGVISLMWLIFGYYALSTVAPGLPEWLRELLWFTLFLGVSIVTIILLRSFFHRELRITTRAFKDANRLSCAHLDAALAHIFERIKHRFEQLLQRLDESTGQPKHITHRRWPTRASEVLKIALWQGKRLEAIDQFRQLQLERLRVLYIQSDWLGNASSYALWLILAIVVSVASLAVGAFEASAPGLLRGVAVAAVNVWFGWQLGYESRRPERSFSMADLAQSGMREKWSHLKYFELVSELYSTALVAIQRERFGGNIAGDVLVDDPSPESVKKSKS